MIHRHDRAASWPFRKTVYLLAIIIGLTISHCPAHARKLLIEGLEEPPLKWLSGKKPQGIDVDIMTEILREMDINDYEFRFVDSGRRLLYNAKQGFSDIVLTLSQNKERSGYLLYPEENHLLLDWRFAIRAEDVDAIHFDDYSDLRAYRIGAAAGYSYTPTFWGSELDIETVARNDLLIPMLLENRFDVVPVNYLSTVYEVLQNGSRSKIAFLNKPLRRAAYYNTFSRASDYPDKEMFLARYDEILREMRHDGRLVAIFKRYLGPDGVEFWETQYGN
ncbi:substrate-binding periplasmic protein [Thalassospira lucentensis]|uniref:substrate-binding periplasmic protein n=1 Tax=Thalassospira lucentensis TaxID=168935 RepID=UPI00142E2972|nr:ABC transporter substrate-binding protein [Thalassospira lucentensis]NIZ03888.1 ABC transporter substrate-binding protein [Thalassospira lucentensis]